MITYVYNVYIYIGSYLYANQKHKFSSCCQIPFSRGWTSSKPTEDREASRCQAGGCEHWKGSRVFRSLPAVDPRVAEMEVNRIVDKHICYVMSSIIVTFWSNCLLDLLVHLKKTIFKPQKLSNNQMQQFFTSPIADVTSSTSISRTIGSSSQCRQSGDLRGDVTRDAVYGEWDVNRLRIMVNGLKKPSRMEVYDIFLLGIYTCIYYIPLFGMIQNDSQLVC